MSELSRSSIFRNVMHQRNSENNNQKTQQKLDLNEKFYSDLEDLYFLLNNAEKLGITNKEKQLVINQIEQKAKDAVKTDAVSFLGKIFDRSLYVLEKCLPEALKEENREISGIPEENKENLIELITKFRAMTLKEKIAYLEEPRNWGIEERKGYVYGSLSSNSTLDLDDFDDELKYNSLYSALTLLDRIIEEREQGQYK